MPRKKVEVNVLAPPKGKASRLSRLAIEEAAEQGLLPHEWLLKVMRGEPVTHKKWRVTYNAKGREISRVLVEEEYYADFATRVEAAKAAAPYFMAKKAAPMVAVVQNGGDNVLNAIEEMKKLAEQLPV